jgi:hypothetical protein
VPLHDLMGHECASDKEAQKYGKLLAHNMGTDRPDLVKESNNISVVYASDREIFRFPLTSLSA